MHTQYCSRWNFEIHAVLNFIYLIGRTICISHWPELTWDLVKDYMPWSLTWDAQSLSALVTWVAGSYFGNQPPGAGGDRHAPSTSAGTNLNRENCQNFPKLTFCQIANWPPPCHSQKRMSVNIVWHASTSPFISKNRALGQISGIRDTCSVTMFSRTSQFVISSDPNSMH